jgi:hypothetical protein
MAKLPLETAGPYQIQILDQYIHGMHAYSQMHVRKLIYIESIACTSKNIDILHAVAAMT